MNKISYNQIKNYLDNTCTEEERKQIAQWILSSKKNEELFFQWEEIYAAGKFKSPDIDKAEKKLFHRIEMEEQKEQKQSSKQFMLLTHRWMKYAASLILLATLSGLIAWYFGQPHEEWITASTQNKETIKFTLPDGSKVWLNENTTLKYPKEFLTDTRQLELDGEAYFEVTKCQQKSFIVHGKSMQIEVVGTKFNFKDRSECELAEASLLEGEIIARKNNSQYMIPLSPGQKVACNAITGKMTIVNTDAMLDAVWHDELIHLDNTDANYITRILETAYGVTITLSPDINKNVTYSGVLPKKDNIEDLLDILKETMHIEYTIDKNKHVFIYTK